MQRGNGAGRLVLAPQLVDQTIARERDSAGHQKQGQEGTLMAAGQRHGHIVTFKNEGTQNSKSTNALGHRDKGTARFYGNPASWRQRFGGRGWWASNSTQSLDFLASNPVRCRRSRNHAAAL